MASNQPSNHATVTPRYRDTTVSEPVEAIRKGVRELGEKAALTALPMRKKKRWPISNIPIASSTAGKPAKMKSLELPSAG